MKHGSHKELNRSDVDKKKKKKDNDVEKVEKKKAKTNNNKEEDAMKRKRKRKKKNHDDVGGADSQIVHDWKWADDADSTSSDDWKSAEGWGHHGCICNDWRAPSESESKSSKSKSSKSKSHKAHKPPLWCSCKSTPHGTISGSMWLDLNNDGIKDDDEPGIGARKVELYLQSAVRGRILHDDNSPVSQAVTDLNGDYTLSTPSDSSYVVRFNLFNTEAECCGPSYRGLDNDINREGSQCAAYYDTNVIEAESTQITNVNGGFVCPLCQGDWDVIVNNADPIPDSPGFDGKNFSSYNAASVNTEGLVVFRARSTGGGNPSTGIFVRDMYDEDSTIRRQAGRRTTVPQSNNLDTKFIEFPSFPRMSINDDNIATRGNHGPVWKYVKDGNETRAGNTGLYFNLAAKYEIETANVRLNLQTGVAKLGNVPEFEIYQVPGLEIPGVVFDVFPGSPAIQDDSTIAFKGNYAKSGVSQTGVFYRQLDGAGQLFVVANSQTNIPEPSTNCNTTTFGSTASPSIVDSKMVFRGLDNEDDPGCGGIYMAEMDSSNYPMLKSLVSLETTVPGEKGGATFTSFGEGLSYDGRAVGFWAGWGDELETISLCCPKTGNKDRRNFCLKNDPNTICNNSTAPDGCDSGCYQNMAVPVNQGIFVYDSEDDSIKAVAKGSTKKGKDFIFWNYSGKPPEAGPTDETDSAEPPRWRSSATVALSQHNSVAYKLKDEDRGSVGIYHSKDEGDKADPGKNKLQYYWKKYLPPMFTAILCSGVNINCNTGCLYNIYCNNCNILAIIAITVTLRPDTVDVT
eukprot:scaffold1789_cov200-Skeletonema_marinoi.AAC.3